MPTSDPQPDPSPRPTTTPWLDGPRHPHEAVTIPNIRLGIGLSLIVHFIALFIWLPRTHLLEPVQGEPGEQTKPLEARLETRSEPAPASAPPPQVAMQTAPPTPTPPAPAPPPRRVTPPPRPRPPPPSPPPPAVLETPKPAAPLPPPIAPSPPPPVARPSPPVEGDLSAFIAARKRERGEPATPAGPDAQAEEERARTDRILAANVGPTQSPLGSKDDRRGGGIFQIKRVGYADAEFEFFGWNKDIGRRLAQVVEVRKEGNSDIRIAVVRRMIAIIRQYEQNDFTWESPRLGRSIVLSARAADNAGLEDFMMQEFFAGGRLR